jgi:preprotein translocase subunit SecE
MGRIQRKKPPGTKKKKIQGTENQTAAGLPDDKESGVKIASSREATVGVAKKKIVFAQKKQAPAAIPVATKPKDNIFTKSAQFLREVKVELKKVTGPSRKQTIGSTIVVIALVMVISLFLGVVDLGISSLIRIVLQ